MTDKSAYDGRHPEPPYPIPGELVEAPPRPLDPFGLIALALDKGLDPEKLYDLAERWQQTQAIAEFNAAMNQCQAEMPAVVKDAENKFTHTRYPKLETVQRAAVPVYTRNGFSLSFSAGDSPLAEHVRIVGILRHRSGHVETHHADIPLDGKGSQENKSAMNKTQAMGSTFSYGKRYLTAMIFNITIADEDDDGQGKNGVITPDQAVALRNLLEQSGASKKKFMEVYGVEAAELFPAARYDEAMKALKGLMERKAKQNGGAGS